MAEISISVNRKGSTASEAHIRNHTVVMDRPEEKGGENQGPMGGENLLASLGGCFMSNLVAAAAARDVDLGEVDLAITGVLAGNPAVFERIDMTVTGSAGVDSLEKLVTIAERGCITANTLKQGLQVNVATATR
ncbi:MAG: OsmC family protein [Ectothiorhodospiraceae bacterium]|jgi:putative redox protein